MWIKLITELDAGQSGLTAHHRSGATSTVRYENFFAIASNYSQRKQYSIPYDLLVSNFRFSSFSISANLPTNIANTDLLTCFFIIVVPFTLWYVNACKWCWWLASLCLPFALWHPLSISKSLNKSQAREIKATYIWFKFRKFKSTTIKGDDFLSFLLTILFGVVRIRTCHYRGRVCLLYPCNTDVVRQWYVYVVYSAYNLDTKWLTWQSLHFHTKFASPRLPGISCCSYKNIGGSILALHGPAEVFFFSTIMQAVANRWDGTKRGSRTYKSVEADPVGMCLSTWSTLYLEGIKIWFFLAVFGMKFSDPV